MHRHGQREGAAGHHSSAASLHPLVGLGVVAALLGVPRILRLLHPQVWIEDESYLTGALMLARGFLPYRDFPLPHFPVLEAFLSVVFRLGGASIRSAEFVTQAAAFVGSLLVFTLGRRYDGILAGSVAALVFATSGLLFRYHVFEREVFLVIPVTLAVLLASGDIAGDAEGIMRPFTIGLALFVALTIKLTAIAAVVAVALQLLQRRRFRSVAIVVSTALASLCILTVALIAVFKSDFIVQVFLFRALHAAFPSLSVKLNELRLTMDLSLALGVAGVGLMFWTADCRRWAWMLFQLACSFVFLVLLNPTYWAHDGIELLPWLSLAGGFLIASAVRAFRARAARTPRIVRTPPVVCMTAAACLLVFVAPIRNLNWQAGDGSIYGFGYRDRTELSQVGGYVHEHSAPAEFVVTPPMMALVADRRELVPYPELAGAVAEISDTVRRRGYVAALTDRNLRHDSFWAGVESSRARIAPLITAAVRERRLAVVVNDSVDDLMPFPLVDVPEETLRSAGYSLEFASPHYGVWLRR